MKRPLLLMSTLLAAGLLFGCSASAMKATPIWDREYPKAIGPAEDRVNLWPIFYYRNPAWAVLWPLISVSDQGSAVVPLYEYDKTKDELRVLTAHQYLPSGATLTPKYKRVLNVVRDTRVTDELNVLPLYFQNFSKQSTVLLPVLWREGKEFWTPLVTSTKNLVGVLGPLFNRFKSGSSTYYHFPFPILGFKTGPGERSMWALPAFYYGRDGRATGVNVGGLLLHVHKEADSWWAFYGAGLGSAAHSPSEAHNWLLPLWSWYRGGNVDSFMSLPYTHIKKGHGEFTDALLIGWIEKIEREGGYQLYQSALWPVFHRFADDEKTGNAVLPVYWYEKDKAGNTDFHSLAFNYKSDGTLLNVLGPAYYRQIDSDGDKYTSVAWPIAHAWTDKNGDKATALLPLFYEKRTADGGRKLVTLAGGLSKHGDEQVLDFGGPLFIGKSNASTGESYHSIAWPILHWWRERDGDRAILMLPVFYLGRETGAYQFISLPVSFGKSPDDKFLNFGALLFHRRISGDRHRGFALANIAGWDYSKKDGDTGYHLFPVFGYQDTPDYREVTSLLNGSYTNKKGEETIRAEWLDANLNPKRDSLNTPRTAKLKSRNALFYMYNSTQWLHREIEPLAAGAKAAPGAVEVKTGSGARAQAVVRKETETFLPALAWYTKAVEGKGSEAYLGWRLYDSLEEKRPDGADYERQRVLWRVFHREKLGDTVAVDMFPFISWDNNPQTGTKRWTFAGGLLGGGKKDSKGYGQVLWVKF